MSSDELAKTIPVRPPTVNKKMNPNDHKVEGEKFRRDPWKVASHLNTLMPVGTAIVIVATVK